MLRQAGPARRFELMAELSDEVVSLRRAALRKAHPLWSDEQIDLKLVEVTYGAGLADKVRQYLGARRCRT